MVVDEVIVRLKAQVEQYKRDLASADSAWDKTVKNVQVGTGVAGTAFKSFAAGFAGAVSVGAIVALGAAFISLSDKAKALDAQLRLATAGFGSFHQAQKDVRAIAMETRAPLEETARLYSTLMRSANELGITQSEAARATETISKAFKISGADAVSAAQGTRQLIQAIQSGTLRGDEFNTMMESAPRLAKLFADSLDVPVKSLRAMAEQGLITSDQLTKALTDVNFTKALDEEFKLLPITFGDAMTQVSNAAMITFSAFDRGGEFSNMLVNFVMSGAESFQELEVRAEIMGGNLKSTISALYNVFDPMGDNAISVFGMIEGLVAGLRGTIGEVLWMIDQVRNAAPNLANRIRENGRNAGIGFMFGNNTPLPSNLFPSYQQGLRKGDNDAALRRIMRADPFADFPRADPRGNYIAPTTKPKKGAKGKSAESAAREAEQRAKRAEREEEAFLKELESLNMRLLDARAAIAVAAEDIYQFNVQQIEAERDNAKAAIDRAASGVDRKYTDAQAEQLKLKQDQIAAAKLEKLAQDERVRLAAAQVEVAKAEMQNDIDLQEASNQFVQTRELQRQAALDLLDLQYQMQRLELEAVIASETSTEAQKQIARERLRILGTLQAYDARAVEEQHRSPGQQYLADLELQAININDELENMAIGKVRELASAFGQAGAEAMGLKGALAQIVAQLIEMAFQQAIVLPLMRAIFGAAGGGGGGVGGLFAGLLGGGGGVAVGGETISSYDMLYGGLFPGAAMGGPARAGQPMVVGERGRELFVPANDGVIVPNHSLSGSGAGGGVVQVEVVGGEYFDARVIRVAGPVSAQVVRASTPQVTDLGAAKTVSKLGRPRF